MLKDWRVAAGLVLSLLLIVFMFWTNFLNNPSSFVEINGVRVNIQVASTVEEQTQGLSGRESLSDNEGLLFVYERPGFPNFWMKDMNFPIDIIWINADEYVVDTTENLGPDTYPQTFSPIEPTKYVLEVNAGYVQENEIEKGNKVIFGLAKFID